MAFLDEAFDVESLPQSESNFEVLPPGWYNASVVSAELKGTKDGTGQYIAVRYDITGPTHQGRQVFGNLNIKNNSSKAEEIGRQQLGELMRSIGLAKVTNTDQLIGGQLQIKLTVTKSEQYGDGNNVGGYKAIAGGSLPIAPSSNAPATATSAPPWAKK